uniref:Uncharacterized protein n=1 Tax=Timema cristinae TaxID=61476 RepID=A0A7R9DNH2_TIMCR|nr:unnamed protein product [Timema cristinae]
MVDARGRCERKTSQCTRFQDTPICCQLGRLVLSSGVEESFVQNNGAISFHRRNSPRLDISSHTTSPQNGRNNTPDNGTGVLGQQLVGSRRLRRCTPNRLRHGEVRT